MRVGPHHEDAIRGHSDDAAVGGGATLDRVAIGASHTGDHRGKEDNRRDENHEYHAENERGDGAASTGQLRHDHGRGSTVALRGCGTRVGSAVRGHRVLLVCGAVGGIRHVYAFLMEDRAQNTRVPQPERNRTRLCVGAPAGNRRRMNEAEARSGQLNAGQPFLA